MRLRILDPDEPWNSDANRQIQCTKCRGFSKLGDAIDCGWKMDLDCDFSAACDTPYCCGVCLHDLHVQMEMSRKQEGDNLQKVSPRG